MKNANNIFKDYNQKSIYKSVNLLLKNVNTVAKHFFKINQKYKINSFFNKQKKNFSCNNI